MFITITAATFFLILLHDPMFNDIVKNIYTPTLYNINPKHAKIDTLIYI